jgi:lipoprotein-anchoring transpeptidase ErfK/SrfK
MLLSENSPAFGSRGLLGSRAPQRPQPRNDGSFWRGENVSGTPKVRISLSEQRAYFYKGDQLVGLSPVASGKEGYRTPAGSFSIQQKNRHHRSTLYGNFVDADGKVVQADVFANDKRPPGTTFQGASMPYFMRFNGPVGMHAGYLPGYAASHGCVRLPEELAAHFFNSVSNGTPVIVTE